VPRDLEVACCICGQVWDPRDPGVLYRSLDRAWWCDDETACTDRRARADIVFDMNLRKLLEDQ
jgi:hypothetical protein